MLITRETDYALRILRTLSDGKSYTAGELAERESLPQKFAYKILKKLEKAGIVQITRGASGGCRLGCDLRTATLYQLIEAVETNARLTSCMTLDTSVSGGGGMARPAPSIHNWQKYRMQLIRNSAPGACTGS